MTVQRVRGASTEDPRGTGGVVAPTRADPVARLASGRLGGPLGQHARDGRSWWTPLRVTLLLATVVFALGVFQKSPCVVTRWNEAASPKAFSHMCYSDISYLYAGRGLAEGIFPYTPISDLSPVEQPKTTADLHTMTVEYPVLTGVWMGVAGIVTRLLGKSPDLSQVPYAAVGNNLAVQHDSAVFWAVNAVGFFGMLLIAVVFLVRAQRLRPWDAALVAAAPSLALTATINWDLVALPLVAGFLWAWSTRRPVVAGIMVGLGTATKLYPLFFLGPLLVLCLRKHRLDSWVKTLAAAVATWLVIDLPVYLWSPRAFLWFWQYNAQRGADFGSVWLAMSTLGHGVSISTMNLAIGLLFGGACVAIAVLGLAVRRPPRLVQLMFLVVASFLLVNKVYSPQYVLWLLPLAALARPRWRDLLIWQACEVFYFFAVWMHIANFFVASGQPDTWYVFAIVVRLAGEIFLMVLVVRDIVRPARDPVRADGLSDDPLGGVLDEGLDTSSPAVHASKAPQAVG